MQCIHEHERDAAIKRPTKTPPLPPLPSSFDLHPPQISHCCPISVSLVLRPAAAHEDQEAASGPAYRLPAALRSIPRAPVVVAAACVARSSGARSSSASGGQARGRGVALLAPRNKWFLRRGSRGRPLLLLAAQAPGIAAAGTLARCYQFLLLVRSRSIPIPRAHS
jgi:hypothetical protein